jgi:uncharacterized membrane protein
MKTALVAGLIAVAALVGCKSQTGVVVGNDTFKVSVPAIGTDVKQGETQLARVTVDRSEGFKQSVKLEVKAPTGLSVAPDNTTVNAGDKGDVQLKITAAKDAPLGDQKIMVKGTPEHGDPVELEFKVTVSAK